MMMEEFLKWLDENEYLKDDDLNYEIITEQYLHSNVIDKIKTIFDFHYLISNTVVWYEEWENIYKCTFSTDWFKDIDTEALNEKLNDIKLNIVNVRVIKKQQKPYSTSTFYKTYPTIDTTFYSNNRDRYEYTFEIGEFEYDEEN